VLSGVGGRSGATPLTSGTLETPAHEKGFESRTGCANESAGVTRACAIDSARPREDRCRGAIATPARALQYRRLP
jgi:hypothetical protein